MGGLHIQPHSHSCTIPSISFSLSSSNGRNKLGHSCCITFVRLGLKVEAPTNRFNFRLKDSVTLLLSSRTITPPAHASNSDSSETLSDDENVSKHTTTEPYAGPPFLTILAGILVFFALCWAFGSILVWLSSLIVKLPPSSSSPK